jgi:hypothetical protein
MYFLHVRLLDWTDLKAQKLAPELDLQLVQLDAFWYAFFYVLQLHPDYEISREDREDSYCSTGIELYSKDRYSQETLVFPPRTQVRLLNQHYYSYYYSLPRFVKWPVLPMTD